MQNCQIIIEDTSYSAWVCCFVDLLVVILIKLHYDLESFLLVLLL